MSGEPDDGDDSEAVALSVIAALERGAENLALPCVGEIDRAMEERIRALANSLLALIKRERGSTAIN